MFHAFTFCNPDKAPGHLEKVGDANSRAEQPISCKLSTFIISITQSFSDICHHQIVLWVSPGLGGT